MAEDRRTQPQATRDAPIAATTERTGEGTIYRTGPAYPVERPLAESVAPTFAVLRDRIRWGPIIAGLVTLITAFTVLEILGLAIGLSTFGPTSNSGAISLAAGIWSAVFAFISFMLGGWVAGKTSAVENADNALLNGFLVGAAGLILLLWLATAGLGNIFGLLSGSAGSIIHLATTNPGALQNGIHDAASLANGANIPADQIQAQARNGAWYTFVAIVIGLLAATWGGWIGYISRHGHDLDAHRPFEARR